jgi:integrative and conjugative element protein (TIGR02256 family)
MDEYFELRGGAEVDASALQLPRAVRLLDAVKRHRDYAPVLLLQCVVDDVTAEECIVVEVECDGIAPKNTVGIRYRERLAFCVPADPKRLVEVLALRKDFPILMHQNQGPLGAPASLCLYFESAVSVARTWTPQGFLRRVQWWLEKSSAGELHAADQPIEQLFFASKYELVLPWNMQALQQDPKNRFAIARGQDRRDQGFTCSLDVLPEGHQGSGTVAHIELTLPPVVHGFVEREPTTLGQLAEMLSRRNTDLLSALKAELQGQVGELGLPVSSENKWTIILLHIPVCRTAGAEPETIARRALLVPAGVLTLGVAAGALFMHEGRYFRDLMNTQPSDTWQEQIVLPMEVLYRNSSAAARMQSGIVAQGPAAVLVGAGSLGSAMLNLWGRSGWGRWAVIDKDHIRPHNLSRHVAFPQQIGESKAKAVANLYDLAVAGATSITAIDADASDFTQEATSQALSTAELVIDVSTTLEYPRSTSDRDDFARHISAFVTPNGEAAVLLVEDRERTRRLRTLEAQYYRALIQEAWGAVHLSGEGSTFWSGAGCRDISVVMPYSRILAHASTLAEQIQAAAEGDKALIRVWQRDPVLGGVTVHDVPVFTEQCMRLGDFRVFIDHGVEHQLRALRTQGFPNETGGILLGYYDFNIDAVIVVAGLPAAPDSQGTAHSFKRGVVGQVAALEDAAKRTGRMVSYIGDWHSHPPGHSAAPSQDDLIQLAHLALGMADDGLPAVQLIVGERDMRILQAEVK